MNGFNEGFPIGMIIEDRYRIDREIGGGGMSYVYLASDQWQNDSFAVVKTPIVKFLDDNWIMKKFKQEAESLVRCNHSGIIKLLAHGKYQNQFPFIVLEYVQGKSLHSIIPEFPGNSARIAKILMQIAEAVEHAHQRKIFHRDLKPENIMVENAGQPDERIKLIDFGIARISNSFFSNGMNTRHQVGTPFYISPNRMRQNPHDRADDIYALGLIAFEIVTGVNPMSSARNFDDLKRLQETIIHPRRLNPHLAVEVDREIVKALSINPSERHQSALEFGKLMYDGILNLKSTQKFKQTKPMPDEVVNTNDITISFESKTDKNPSDEVCLPNAISEGERFLISGEFDSAIAYYDEKIAQNSISDLFYTRRALGLLLKKDYEKAMLDCQKALKLNESNDFAHLIRGIIYRLKLWTSEAETELLKAVKINQNNIMASLVLGDIYASTDEKEKSLNYYAHVCRVHPAFSWVYTNRGNLFYEKRDYLSAIKDFTLAVDSNPQMSWNFYRRAKSFLQMGKTDEAVRDLSKAINLEPKNPNYYNERAKILFNLGRSAEALADFFQVKELSSRDSFIANEQKRINDNRSGLASLIDYLKWILLKK
jgi:serine/threonine protein kinase